MDSTVPYMVANWLFIFVIITLLQANTLSKGDFLSSFFSEEIQNPLKNSISDITPSMKLDSFRDKLTISMKVFDYLFSC